MSLLLDTGASFCMLSEKLVDRLGSAVRSRVRGGFGLANMNGGAWEATNVETVSIGDFEWAGVQLQALPAVTRPEGNFEGMMSSGTPAPVEGAIAGNLLQALRLEWDASEQAVWIEQKRPVDAAVSQVPVVLHAHDGALRVVGATQSAQDDGIRVGDELVAVDGERLAASAFGDAVSRLRGEEGEVRHLEFLRDGSLASVRARVAALA